MTNKKFGLIYKARTKEVTSLRTSAPGCLQANCRVWNVIQTELFRTNKEARIKEVTGLIYISVRPNLLRPFNACGMVQRNSSILADRLSSDFFACGSSQRNSFTRAFICTLGMFPYFPGNTKSSDFLVFFQLQRIKGQAEPLVKFVASIVCHTS